MNALKLLEALRAIRQVQCPVTRRYNAREIYDLLIMSVSVN